MAAIVIQLHTSEVLALLGPDAASRVEAVVQDSVLKSITKSIVDEVKAEEKEKIRAAYKRALHAAVTEAIGNVTTESVKSGYRTVTQYKIDFNVEMRKAIRDEVLVVAKKVVTDYVNDGGELRRRVGRLAELAVESRVAAIVKAIADDGEAKIKEALAGLLGGGGCSDGVA